MCECAELKKLKNYFDIINILTGQGLETEEFFSDVFAQEPGFSD